MTHPAWNRLDTCLAHMVDYSARMRQLDLSVEADRLQAVEESRRLLGVVLMYREALERLGQNDRPYARLAA
jgi:hypothetical protein